MLLKFSTVGLMLFGMQAFADDEYGSRGGYRGDNGWHKGQYKRDKYRDRGNYGNYGYRGGNYGYRGGAYGYDDRGRGSSIVDRTLSDLRNVSSRNRVDNHERGHFQRASSELQSFQYRLAEGRWDEGRLDRAIEDLSDLAQADQIHPRDRQLLARDMAALQQFRASRGGNYNWR